MALTNAQLMQRLVDFLARFNDREDEFQAWLAGPADGGPFGDGRYPLSDFGGSTRHTKSPAKLEDMVQGLVDSAAAFESGAEDARDEAVGAAAQAGTAASDAASAASSAASDRLNAQGAASESSNHRAAAQAQAALARRWANEDPNVVVADGEYSAKHYVQLLGSLAQLQSVVDEAEAARDAAEAAEAASLARLATTVGHQATMASALLQLAQASLTYNPMI